MTTTKTVTTKKHLHASGEALCGRGNGVDFATESTKVVDTCGTCLRAAMRIIRQERKLQLKLSDFTTYDP